MPYLAHVAEPSDNWRTRARHVRQFCSVVHLWCYNRWLRMSSRSRLIAIRSPLAKSEVPCTRIGSAENEPLVKDILWCGQGWCEVNCVNHVCGPEGRLDASFTRFLFVVFPFSKVVSLTHAFLSHWRTGSCRGSQQQYKKDTSARGGSMTHDSNAYLKSGLSQSI